MGAAASVGALSVPPSWGTAATPTWLAGMPLATPLPGVSAEVGEGCRSVFRCYRAALGRAAGMAAAAGVGGAVASRYGPRLKVLTRSPGRRLHARADGSGRRVPSYRPGLPPTPGYTPHIVYLPNNGQNGNGYNGHNGNGPH